MKGGVGPSKLAAAPVARKPRDAACVAEDAKRQKAPLIRVRGSQGEGVRNLPGTQRTSLWPASLQSRAQTKSKSERRLR